jgi:N-acetylglucosaminyldiphosphoundecaprenol N-acetyl-beta-D-mannosaminyltransferase
MKFDFIGLPIFDENLSVLITKVALRPSVISCVNAWSFYCYHKQTRFQQAVQNSFNLPDGISIVWGSYLTNKQHLKRITGIDVLYFFLVHAKELAIQRIMFLGSSEKVLFKIKEKATQFFPDLEFSFVSPPFKDEFSLMDVESIQKDIVDFKPQLIFVGLSAPKQEIFTEEHLKHLSSIKYICNVGAAFEYYAGTEMRAPLLIQKMWMEGVFRYLFHPVRHFLKDIRSIPFLFYKVLKYRSDNK